jgi:hypothetical protein
MSDDYDIFRETTAHTENGEPFQVKPYGELEGLLFKFDEPLHNYDASRPYTVSVIISRAGTPDEEQPSPRITVQSICRTIGGKLQEGAHRGETPIL